MSSLSDYLVPILLLAGAVVYSEFYRHAFGRRATVFALPPLLGVLYAAPEVVLFPTAVIFPFLLVIPNACVLLSPSSRRLRWFAGGANLPLVVFFAYWTLDSLEIACRGVDIAYATGALPTLAPLHAVGWGLVALLASPLFGILALLFHAVFARGET
jgi:hypothetical protein